MRRPLATVNRPLAPTAPRRRPGVTPEAEPELTTQPQRQVVGGATA